MASYLHEISALLVQWFHSGIGLNVSSSEWPFLTICLKYTTLSCLLLEPSPTHIPGCHWNCHALSLPSPPRPSHHQDLMILPSTSPSDLSPLLQSLHPFLGSGSHCLLLLTWLLKERLSLQARPVQFILHTKSEQPFYSYPPWPSYLPNFLSPDMCRMKSKSLQDLNSRPSHPSPSPTCSLFHAHTGNRTF